MSEELKIPNEIKWRVELIVRVDELKELAEECGGWMAIPRTDVGYMGYLQFYPKEMCYDAAGHFDVDIWNRKSLGFFFDQSKIGWRFSWKFVRVLTRNSGGVELHGINTVGKTA